MRKTPSSKARVHWSIIWGPEKDKDSCRVTQQTLVSGLSPLKSALSLPRKHAVCQGPQSRMAQCACCVLSHFSRVRCFVTLWTVARQAPLSMGFSRQEYWSGLPFPTPGDLPDPGIKPASLRSPALAGRFFTTNATWEAPVAGTKSAAAS